MYRFMFLDHSSSSRGRGSAERDYEKQVKSDLYEVWKDCNVNRGKSVKRSENKL